MTFVEVSVIVPVYNVEKYLQRCITSLVNQTFGNIEILLVDDGSTDTSKDICEKNSLTDPRIKVLHKKNGGLSSARNYGLNQSIGDKIVFIDSDDWCERNFIEKLNNRMNECDSEIVVCGYEIEYTNNNFTVKKSLDEESYYTGNEGIAEAVFKLDSKGMFNVVWNKMYKKEIIVNYNLKFDLKGMPGEDLLFNCDYFKLISSVSFVNSSLLHYMRQDEETLVSKYRPELYEKVIKFNTARKKLYSHLNMLNNAVYKQCNINKSVENIAACVPNLFRVNNKLNLKQKKKFVRELMEDGNTNRLVDQFIPNNFYDKFFKLLYQTNKASLFISIYGLLFKFRHAFNGSYRIIRKQILK